MSAVRHSPILLEEVTNHIQKITPNESCYITCVKVHVEANP